MRGLLRLLILAAFLLAALCGVLALAASAAMAAPLLAVGLAHARRYRLPRLLDHRPKPPRYQVSRAMEPPESYLHSVLYEESRRLPEATPRRGSSCATSTP